MALVGESDKPLGNSRQLKNDSFWIVGKMMISAASLVHNIFKQSHDDGSGDLPNQFLVGYSHEMQSVQG